ncbi:response regulator transcription factor [Methylosinus sp. LW4]|uniref:response regulator transcription factor n=1 Tax=Methylosinus sp. LW4 TaxID=136993 RepID=UPI00037ACF14|nr:response regulator transcription factor [Methylosinus sp. LW4]
MHILIVEDNVDLATKLAEQVTSCGFDVDRAGSIREAREIIDSRDFALVVLDRRLPDGDGIGLVPEIRRLRPRMRVLMLTALDDEEEMVAGLDAGADDYLTKPYNPKELTARIRANLRRLDGDRSPSIRLGELSFAPDSREVAVRGEAIVLQRRELDLLETLMRKPGRVALRDRLLEDFYGDKDELHVNNLNVVVSHLRRRLKECGAGVEIHAARGIGYFIAKSSA